MQAKLAWRLWALSLALILIALVELSLAFDINTIGATGRFAWNAVIAALLTGARALDWLLGYVLRRRVRRIASFFTAIGLGYSGNVILTHAQIERAKGWQGFFRKFTTRVRNRWQVLGTPWKFVCVAVMIAAQIALLPVLSQYVLLIPIGFMIPIVARQIRSLYAWIADSIFGAVYWRYFGSTHRTALRELRTIAPVHALRGGARLLRMRYLAAWRLWKYDHRYRDPSGELWVSLLEPIRLWRERKLDLYVGHPLLGGKQVQRSCTPDPSSRLPLPSMITVAAQPEQIKVEGTGPAYLFRADHSSTSPS